MSDTPENTATKTAESPDSPLSSNPPKPDTTNIIATCGTCVHARVDDRLPQDKRICRDGYGYKHMNTKGCGAWTAIGIEG